jgi:hypothetical protein
MLTILLVIVLILLLTGGGLSFRRRGRRGLWSSAPRTHHAASRARRLRVSHRDRVVGTQTPNKI